MIIGICRDEFVPFGTKRLFKYKQMQIFYADAHYSSPLPVPSEWMEAITSHSDDIKCYRNIPKKSILECKHIEKTLSCRTFSPKIIKKMQTSPIKISTVNKIPKSTLFSTLNTKTIADIKANMLISLDNEKYSTESLSINEISPTQKKNNLLKTWKKKKKKKSKWKRNEKTFNNFCTSHSPYSEHLRTPKSEGKKHKAKPKLNI